MPLEFAPLFSFLRGSFEEVQVTGAIAFFAPGKANKVYPDNFSFPARSLLKPFQYYATGLWQQPDWEPNEASAVCLGSISATQEQVEVLRKRHQRNPRLEHLKVPVSYPTDEGHRVSLKAQKKDQEQVYHNCFSKHLAILESIQQAGEPLETYLEVDHPYHRRLEEVLAGWLPEEKRPFQYVVDGCGLPNPVFKLESLARLYAELASSEEPGFREITQLFLRYPQWIGGPNRLDTRLMEKNPKGLIAKEGADGLWGIGILPCERFPKGAGLVLKLAPGYFPLLAGYVLSPLLKELGFEGLEERLPRGQTWERHFPSL